MTYINQAQDPRRRRAAIVAVVAIHGVLGYMLVTGLSYSRLIEVIKNPDGVFIPDVPLPDPSPEPDPLPSAAPEQPMVAPVPPLPLPPLPGPRVEPFDPNLVITDVIPRPDPGPTFRPEPPRPAPTFTATGARPSNNSAGWITNDDYPRSSLVEGNEGLARYRVVVGTNGRAASCEVTTSTGDRRLDEATCKFITRRARFEPATDETGGKVLGTYSGTVRWQIPD